MLSAHHLFVIVVLYFILMGLSLFWRSPIMAGRWFFLLRSFFPNWKFYQSTGHIPMLFFRCSTCREALETAEWQLMYPRAERRWWHLFHNPETNLKLAQQNLIDHFHADLYELSEDADPCLLVSYKMVAQSVADLCEKMQASCWQFQLRLVHESPTAVLDDQVMMTSPEVSI
jgi:hypothetical protein